MIEFGLQNTFVRIPATPALLEDSVWGNTDDDGVDIRSLADPTLQTGGPILQS